MGGIQVQSENWPRMRDSRPEVAEAIGVFFLVLTGGGAILASFQTGAPGPLGVALAFGFTLTVLVYALGHVCGAHFNPAITLGFAATGHFPWRRVPTYLVAQVAGATLAAFLLKQLPWPMDPLVTQPAFGVTPGAAFFLELAATALLALVIIGVATDRRAAPGAAGLAIGLAVAVGALFAGPLTGGSMNPARSLGPALAAMQWNHLWIYLVAPIAGALFAMGVYEWLRPARLTIQPTEPLGALGPITGLEDAGE